MYGRQPDLRDPFEKEAFREWERKYRDWYEKYYKGLSVNPMPRPRSPLGRENFQDNRYLLPHQARREHSPFNRSHRDNYPPPLVPRLRPGASNYPEKLLPREAHVVKETRRSKEREAFVPAGDSRGSKHRKHRKKRKDEGEGPSKPVVEPSRKHRDSHGEDVKRGEPLFVPTSKDDATPVRDEPMDAESVAPKSLSDKDRRDKPRGKPEKTKRRTEGVQPKKDNSSKVVKNEKASTDGDKAKPPSLEPPTKKVKDETQKNENSKHTTLPKDEKSSMLPRKVHLKAVKENPDSKQSKDDKNKKEHSKDLKQDIPAAKEEKVKKAAEKTKTVDSKPEKRKRKADEKSSEKALEKPPVKTAKTETAEASKQPVAKVKTESEVTKSEKVSEKAAATTTASSAATTTTTVKKIKLNRETGKKIANSDAAGVPEETQEKTESAAVVKAKSERAKGKVKKKITAADGSTLVDYTR